MALRVIIPPAPFLTPTDISSSYAADDPKILALIAAATGEIDGPDGWLGRAIAPQTIELQRHAPDRRRHDHLIWLPCPPVIAVASVVFLDHERAQHTVDDSLYELTLDGLRLDYDALPGINWRDPDALRVQYQAGYNGTSVADGGTGDIPAQIKQAVTFSVQQLSALSAENLFLGSETVEGIGSTTYIVSPNAETLIRNTMDRLLGGLRVWQ